MARARRILLLLRDITPEGKWTTNDDDDPVLPGGKRAFQTWNSEYRAAIPGVRYPRTPPPRHSPRTRICARQWSTCSWYGTRPPAQPPGVRTVFQELFNPPAFASIQEEPPTSGELQTRVWLADWDARFWEWHCDAAEAAECQLLRISPRRTMGPCSYAAAAGRAQGTAGPRAALAARARLWAPTDGAQRGGARGAATKRRNARPTAFWVHAAPRQNSCSSATREANPAKILAVRASPSRW